MSVAEFSPVLRERIISLYSDRTNKLDLANFGKLTRKELFKAAPETKDLRTKFQAKDFHSSSLTLEGLSALTKRIIDTWEDASTKELVVKVLSDTNLFSNFISYIENEAQQGNKLLKNVVIEDLSGTSVVLRNIPEKNLRLLFKDFLTQKTNLSSSAVEYVINNVESGHLAGIFSLKLKAALGIQTQFSTEERSYRDFSITVPGLQDPKAIEFLESVLKAVLDADYLTSNLITESQVFIEATKNALGEKPSLITELQFEADNQTAGRLLQQTGKRLNELIKAASKGEMSATEQAIKDMVTTLQPLVDTILAKAEQLKDSLDSQQIYKQIVDNANKLANEFINTPGSVTIKDGIGLTVAEVIRTGKILPAKTTKVKPKPAKQKHKETLDISKVAQEFKQAVQKVKQAVKKQPTKITGKAVKPVGTLDTSLANLQLILDANLVERVKQNMGSGNRRDILNLRTGRFAESVRVERLSQSRQGMITAFYTYMRNPYATFSAGGRQELPRSRDPKLLISKSIRQVLGEQVSNRLRAVLV